MKRIIATVFLFIFISAFSLATFAEEAYPVERYFVYVSEYVSPGVYQEVNVTSSVSINGLTLTLPHITEPSTQIRIILTSLPASTSQPINKSVYSISGSVSLSWVNNQSFLPQNFTGRVENQKFKSTLPNPQYPDAGANYEVDGSASISNNISFSIAPSSQLSARLVFYLDLGSWLSGAPVITFNDLYINNENIIDKIVIEEKIDDAKEQMGMIIDPVLSDSDALHELEDGVIVDLYNGMPAVDQAFSDAADWMDDISSSGVGFGRVMLTIYNETPFFGAISVVVAILALVSFVLFGRAL